MLIEHEVQISQTRIKIHSLADSIIRQIEHNLCVIWKQNNSNKY